MIDIERETKLTIDAACRRPELQRNGRKPHKSSLWRWIASGKLETVKVGGTTLTSVEAIRRMIANDNPGMVLIASVRARNTQIAQVNRELELAGI